jgi:hypothetical protein
LVHTELLPSRRHVEERKEEEEDAWRNGRRNGGRERGGREEWEEAGMDKVELVSIG